MNLLQNSKFMNPMIIHWLWGKTGVLAPVEPGVIWLTGWQAIRQKYCSFRNFEIQKLNPRCFFRFFESIFKPGECWPSAGVRLVSFVCNIGMSVCVCVPPPQDYKLHSSNIESVQPVNKFVTFRNVAKQFYAWAWPL